MNTEERRNKIYNILASSEQPVSASSMAEQFSVSRQIVVGDIAILRASGIDISATPKGYVLSGENHRLYPYVGIVACRHGSDELLKKELYTVADYGGTVIDVTVEHSVYGQISGMLSISSRYDADQFLNKVKSNDTHLLSDLTSGIHIHHIGCRDEKNFEIIREALRQEGILL